MLGVRVGFTKSCPNVSEGCAHEEERRDRGLRDSIQNKEVERCVGMHVGMHVCMHVCMYVGM